MNESISPAAQAAVMSIVCQPEPAPRSDPVIGTVAGATVYGYEHQDGVTRELLRWGAYADLNGLTISVYPQTEPDGYPDHIGINNGRGLDFTGELFYADVKQLVALGNAIDELMELARRWCQPSEPCKA